METLSKLFPHVSVEIVVQFLLQYVCVICGVCGLQEMSWVQWEAVALFRRQGHVLVQQLWLGQGPAVPHLQGRRETESSS